MPCAVLVIRSTSLSLSRSHTRSVAVGKGTRARSFFPFLRLPTETAKGARRRRCVRASRRSPGSANFILLPAVSRWSAYLSLYRAKPRRAEYHRVCCRVRVSLFGSIVVRCRVWCGAVCTVAYGPSRVLFYRINDNNNNNNNNSKYIYRGEGSQPGMDQKGRYPAAHVFRVHRLWSSSFFLAVIYVTCAVSHETISRLYLPSCVVGRAAGGRGRALRESNEARRQLVVRR